MGTTNLMTAIYESPWNRIVCTLRPLITQINETHKTSSKLLQIHPRESPQEASLDPPKQKALPHPDRTPVVLRLLLFRNIASDCVLHILSVERSAAETTILETPVLAHMQLSHNMTLCARASYEASLKSQYLQKTHYLQKTQYHTGSCRCWVDGVSPPQA